MSEPWSCWLSAERNLVLGNLEVHKPYLTPPPADELWRGAAIAQLLQEGIERICRTVVPAGFPSAVIALHYFGRISDRPPTGCWATSAWARIRSEVMSSTGHKLSLHLYNELRLFAVSEFEAWIWLTILHRAPMCILGRNRRSIEKPVNFPCIKAETLGLVNSQQSPASLSAWSCTSLVANLTWFGVQAPHTQYFSGLGRSQPAKLLLPPAYLNVNSWAIPFLLSCHHLCNTLRPFKPPSNWLLNILFRWW